MIMANSSFSSQGDAGGIPGLIPVFSCILSNSIAPFAGKHKPFLLERMRRQFYRSSFKSCSGVEMGLIP